MKVCELFLSKYPLQNMSLTKALFTRHKLQFALLLGMIGVYMIVSLCKENAAESFKEAAPPEIYHIYIKPYGRLGNNLYHLAASYAIVEKNHRKLVLTPRYIHNIKTLLNISCLDVETATVPNGINTIGAYRNGVYVNNYDPALLGHRNDRDLELIYIRVMRYFLPYGSLIRNHMVINDNLVQSTQQLLHSLQVAPHSTFVGIHVRRGDRTGSKAKERGHLIPKKKFFKNAMTYYLSKYTNVIFIVCSDDMKWSKKHLYEGMLNSAALYAIHFSPGAPAEWDMALLAQCNHSIMSVGTFGWWGAWFAGGETIYFNHSVREGSKKDKKFKPENYFWPTWIGMDDK